MNTCKNCFYNVFKDWQSALGWGCTIIILFCYLGMPVCEMVLHLFDIPYEFTRSDAGRIFALTTTMVSIAGMKTYEKIKTRGLDIAEGNTRKIEQ